MDYELVLEGVSEIGARMLAGGAEIYRVEDTVSRLLNAYGLKGEVFALPTCLIVSFSDDEGHSHSRMRRLDGQPSTDIEVVEHFNGLSRAVCAAPPPPERLTGMADAASSSCRHYSMPMVLLGYFLGSFFFTFLFRGGFREALVAGIASTLAGLCVAAMNELKVNFFFNTVVASAVLGAVVYAVSALGAPIDTGVTVIGGLMTLVPGVAFTSFMSDLITGDALSGVSMFVRAVLTAGGIALGTGAALWLFRSLGANVEGVVSDASYGILAQCAASFVACAGFALLYNVHGAVGIALCCLGGALGWAVDLSVGAVVDNAYLCCFAATVVITVYAEIMARVRKFPMTSYLVVSYFPLVPGSWIYYTMYHAIHGETELFWDAAVRTLGIAACIATGTMLVMTAMRSYTIWRRRRAS